MPGSAYSKNHKQHRNESLIPLILVTSCREAAPGVTLTVVPEQHRVEVGMDGELFTVYRFEPVLEKPILIPVNAPPGALL